MFPMPELSYGDVDKIVRRALDAACWDLAGVRDYPDDPRFVESAEESRARLEAWVNYQRQTFPDMESSCMLDYEKHWRARLPFERGQDRWEYFATGNTWTIIKPNGKVIATRHSKE